MDNKTNVYPSIDTPAKELLRQKILEILTPELREQCDGLVVTVHSIEEQQVISNALKEVAARKRRQRNKQH